MITENQQKQLNYAPTNKVKSNEVANINTAACNSNSEYFLRIYADKGQMKGVGHFFIGIVKGDQEAKIGIGAEKIGLITKSSFLVDHKGRGVDSVSKAIPLTQEQFTNVEKFVTDSMNKDIGVYIPGFKDCIKFTSDAYRALVFPASLPRRSVLKSSTNSVLLLG